MDFKVYKLTRVSSTHKNLRTDIVVGTMITDLEIGSPIIMSANGLVFGSRHIQTTAIIKIEGNHYFTSNSEYIIEEVTDGE